MAKFTSVFLVPLLILAGFLLPQFLFATAPLLISQVQIASDTNVEHDFVKIYNPNDFDINLQNYHLIKRTKTNNSNVLLKSFDDSIVLPAKTTITWANSKDGFANSIGADVSKSETISANNSIAIIFGDKNSGEIIDAVAWGSADNGLVEGTNFPDNPGKGQILTRKNNQDTNNNASDFELSGSVSNSNTPPNLDSEIQEAKSDTKTQDYKGQIIINEVVSNPESGSSEWIELFNTTGSPIKLQDWTIEDGSGSKTILKDIIDNYLLIDSPKGNLNNAGDLIILKDAQGQIVDQLAYGNWQEATDNLPTPNTGTSLARHPDNHSQWSLTSTPTPLQTNIISEAVTSDTPDSETKQPAKPCPIIISEILPNPQGADSTPIGLHGEFIELYNRSDASINLLNWRLLTEPNKSLLLPEIILPAHNFIQLSKQQFKFSLPNLANTVKLYEIGKNSLCFQIKYPEASEAISWNLDFNTLEQTTPSWLWSLTPTPGRINQLQTINSQPRAVINYDELNPNHFFFDGTDSSDPDGQVLKYHWDFDDGMTSDLAYSEHYFHNNGNHQVTLTVSDGHLQHSQSTTIKIKGQPTLATATALTQTKSANTITPKIKIATSKANTTKAVKPVAITSKKTSSNNLTLTGTIIVQPNSFSSQYFYIITNNQETWQIYRQKADWPDFNLGDIVTATGKRSPITTARRLLVSDLADINIIEQGPEPNTTVITSDQASKYLEKLISISGQVTDRQGDSIYLDDGHGEILVRFKSATTLNAKNFSLGNSYTISGLLLQGSKELELWPRSITDTNLMEQVLGDKITATTSANLNIEERAPSHLASQLLVVSIIIIIILIILLIKSFYKK